MSNRNIGFDLLRVVLIFTVVLIHTPSVGGDAVRQFVLRFLPPANACFAFLAGWFMMSVNKVGFREWFSKRFHRLLIPYLVWECIYLAMNFGFDVFSGKFSWPSVIQWCDILFWGGASTQLWFIITLFYVQSILSFALKVMKLEKVHRAVWLVVGLLAILMHYSTGLGHLRSSLFMLGYVCLGMGATAVFSGKTFQAGRRMCVAILLISILVNLPEVFRAVAWVGVFGGISLIGEGRLQNYILSIGGMAMGVYLCHFLFTRMELLLLSVCGQKAFSCFAMNVIQLVLLALLAMLMSVVFVLIVRKIRLAKLLGI